MTAPAPPERPTGVTLLALWSIVVGVGLVAVTLYAVYVLRRIPQALAAFVTFPEGLVLISASILAIEAAIAYGLWTLRPWARILALAFAAVSFATGMLTLPIGAIGVAFSIASVWYLTEKKTRSLFRSADRVARGP